MCILLLLMAGGVFAQVQTGSAYPKREFRAAWIQSVNGQFRGMPTEKLKQNLDRSVEFSCRRRESTP